MKSLFLGICGALTAMFLAAAIHANYVDYRGRHSADQLLQSAHPLNWAGIGDLDFPARVASIHFAGGSFAGRVDPRGVLSPESPHCIGSWCINYPSSGQMTAYAWPATHYYKNQQQFYKLMFGMEGFTCKHPLQGSRPCSLYFWIHFSDRDPGPDCSLNIDGGSISQGLKCPYRIKFEYSAN